MKKINSLLRITALVVFTAVLLGFGMIVPKYLTDRKIHRLSGTNTAVDINEVKPFGIESIQIIQTIQNTLKDLETYNSLNSGRDGYDMYVKSVGKKKVKLDSVKKIMESLSPHLSGNWEIYETQLFVPKGRKADDCNLAIVTIQHNYEDGQSFYDFYVEKKSGIVLQAVMIMETGEKGTEYMQELWESSKNDLAQIIGMPLSDRTAEDSVFDGYLKEYKNDLMTTNILNKYVAISLDQQLVFKTAAVSISMADPETRAEADAAAALDPAEGTPAETEVKEPEKMIITYIFAIESL